MDPGKSLSDGVAPAAGFVLVADDDATMRDILRSLLSTAGYTVLLAATGQEALSLAPRINASLAILDLDMPHGNGLQICVGLRKIPHWVDVPILVLTHHHTDRALRAAMRVGASGFVGKPFVPAELLRRIVAYTGWQGRNAETGSPFVWYGDPTAGCTPIPSAPVARPRTAGHPIVPPSLDQQWDTLKILRNVLAPEAERHTPRVKPARQQFRVLVGEADPTGQEAIRAILSSAGVIVEFVADGRAVLWKLLNDHYDVVVLDIHLPGASGIEIAHSIRALRGSKGNTPIIALAQSVAHLLGQDLRDAGINDHVIKPATSETLLSCLSRHLPARLTGESALHTGLTGEAPDVANLQRVAKLFPPETFVGILGKLAVAVEKILSTLGGDASKAMPDELARQLHSLAGTAGTVGCNALSAAAHELNADPLGAVEKRQRFIDIARASLTVVATYLATEAAVG